MKIIIHGPLEHADWALELIKENAADFTKGWLKVGRGWSYTTSKRPGVIVFLARLKDGVSARVSVALPRPTHLTSQPQNDGED